MNDLKRISIVAVFLLVLLRISIGWQFVYEGWWKYSTLQSANPWTAEGYLKNSQGPFRDHFRGITGDPDDLNWLDYEMMSQKWDAWQTDFLTHYSWNEELSRQHLGRYDEDGDGRLALSELPERLRNEFRPEMEPSEEDALTQEDFREFAQRQQQELTDELTRMLEGPTQHVANLEAIPAAATESFEKQGVIEFDAENSRLVVQGNTPLQAREAAALKASVNVVAVPGSSNDLTDVYAQAGPDGGALRDADGVIVAADPLETQFFQAIDRLERESAKLGFRQRLRALLEGDPDRVGVVSRMGDESGFEMGSIPASEQSPEAVNVNFGRVQQYRDELAAYEDALARAQDTNLAYEWDHVQTLGAKLASLRAELVGPIRALEAEMNAAAWAELTPEQIARGSIPPDFEDPLTQASMAALAGLLILGVLLILGLCTRLSALLGAVMLMGFYFVLPPWPGVPQPPSPEHSFIVNKNLIEAVALLGIAALPTGSWFGLDGLFRWLIRRGKSNGEGGSGRRGSARVKRG